MPDDTQINEVTFRSIVEILLHGAVYDETNDSENIATLRLEADKTLRTHALQVYMDALRNEQIARISTDRVIWKREFYDYLQTDGVELPNAEGALWAAVAPENTADDHYEIYYHACNIDIAAAIVMFSIGHGVGAGAMGNADFWSRMEILPVNTNTGWRGPWVIAGNDTVRGNAVGLNDVAVSFRIRKVDIGA